MKYKKDHPLRPVYDLQRGILKRGGRIDWDSDLLAYFEKRSLVPEIEANDVILNLAHKNEEWYNKNYSRTKSLIRLEKLIYWNPIDDDHYIIPMKPLRIKVTDKPNPGYGHNLPSGETTGKEEKGYFLNDNEYVIRRNGISYVIVIDEKYKDVFRFIINGYIPCPNNIPDNKKYIFIAMILGISIVIASFIMAQSFRYEVRPPSIIDKWTGESKLLKY